MYICIHIYIYIYNVYIYIYIHISNMMHLKHTFDNMVSVVSLQSNNYITSLG